MQCPHCNTANRPGAGFCTNCGTSLKGSGVLSPGTVLQRGYRVIRQLGGGGMGDVYLVEHTALGEQMALKEIKTAALVDPVKRAEAIQQFQNEARILARLRHRHLPRVTDFFEENGQQYLVMDRVDGENLEEILARTPGFLPEKELIEWAVQICDVLTYLHGQNPPVIFRDLKPGNIMIERDSGQVKLIHFGIARLFNPAKGTDTLKMGSPGYAPPEQYSGHGGTDQRADIYALGATLHHLATKNDPQNEPPFYFPHAPVRKFNPVISDGLIALIEKTTEYRREDRFDSAVQTKAALETCLKGRRTVPPPPPLPLQPLTPPPQLKPLTQGRVSVPTAPAKKGIPSWLAWAGLAAALVIVGLVIAWISSPNPKPVTVTETDAPEVAVVQPSDTPDLSQPTPCTQIGQTWASPIDGMILVCVPAGEFTMGSEDGDDDEKPVRTIYLDAYWIDQTEVTNELFASFLTAVGNQEEGGVTWLDASDDVSIEQIGGAWRPKSGYADHPVVEVSWYGARAYCEWLGGRLPTEAEWEKAARGGLEGKKYPWGDASPVCTPGVENGAQYGSCDGQTVPVKTFSPNGYGLYDIAGNVWEWVADWYNVDYYARALADNPQGANSGDYRVLRGGSWISYRWLLRSVNRARYAPGVSGLGLGFRCAGGISP